MFSITDKGEAFLCSMWFHLEQVKQCRKIDPSSVAFLRPVRNSVKSEQSKSWETRVKAVEGPVGVFYRGLLTSVAEQCFGALSEISIEFLFFTAVVSPLVSWLLGWGLWTPVSGVPPPYQIILTAFGWIAIPFCTDINGPQKRKPNPEIHLVPHFRLWMSCHNASTFDMAPGTMAPQCTAPSQQEAVLPYIETLCFWGNSASETTSMYVYKSI